MAGEITRKELHPDLLEELLASGGTGTFKAGKIMYEVVPVTITAETTRQVPIPKEDYILGVHNFEVRIGGIPIPQEKYSIQNKKIVLASGEGDFPIGRRLDFVFIYLKESEQNVMEQLVGVKPANVEIEGRTLINRLGRVGNAIYKQWNNGATSTTAWKCNVTYENDKFVLTSTEVATMAMSLSDFYTKLDMKEVIKLSKYYIVLAEAETDANCTDAKIYPMLEGIANTKQSTIGSNTKGTIYCGINATRTASTEPSFWYLDCASTTTAIGAVAKFKDIRVYEITKEIYDKIDVDGEYTGDKLIEKYPHVDDIKCVVNPYVECKENLLDGDRWQHGAVEPNGNVINSETGNVVNIDKSYFSKKGEQYTLCIENIDTSVYDLILWNMGGTQKTVISQTNSATITCEYDGVIKCGIKRRDGGRTTEQISEMERLMNFALKPTLVKGSTSKTYEECHNSRVMFETKLYDGEKITRDNSGTYVKTVNTNEIILNDCNVGFSHTVIGKNRKVFTFTVPNKSDYHLSHILGAIKYNGEILTIDNVWSEKDAVGCNTKTYFIISFSNSLTGWGESYTPTYEEIKAFFLGYQMSVRGSNAIYNGTGEKQWCKLWCGVGEKISLLDGQGAPVVSGWWTPDCPTTMNDQGYTPYRLIYKKATPTIEEVKTHGSLVVKDGIDVKVSSGLIMGYKAPHQTSGGRRYINGGTSQLLENGGYRVEDFVKVYNNKYEYIPSEVRQIAGAEWTIRTGKCNYGFNMKYEPDFFIDYLIYRPDTVTSFPYTLTTPQTTEEILEKTIQELSNINEKLSSENRELHNKVESLLQISNPNLLINGDFQVWQRGEDFPASTIHGKYTADRWQVTRSSVNSVSASKVVDDNGVFYRLKVDTYTQETGSYINLQHYLELDLYKKLIGKKVTVSIKLRNPSYINVIGIRAFPDGSVVYKPTQTSDFYQHTFTVPKCSTECQKFFFYLQKLEVGILDIEYIKMEIGEVATPHIPRPYAEELAMCQRYYENNFNGYCILNAHSTTELYGFSFITEKRVNPTVSYRSYKNTPNLVSTLAGVDVANSTLRECWGATKSVEMVRLNSAVLTKGETYTLKYEADAEIY